MTPSQLKICSICTNRKMTREIGLVCSLTDKKPNFEVDCPQFNIDEKESKRKLDIELKAVGDIKTSSDASPKYLVNSGVLAVIIGPLAFFLFGTLWGIAILVMGILLIIKGENQKHILKQNKKLHEKLKSDSGKK